MSKKTVKKNTTTLEKRANQVKATVKKVHADVLVATDELVEESLATGQKWQKIFAKVLKGGTKMFAKQQDFTVEAVKTIKGQMINSNKRMRDLLEFEVIEDAIEDARKDIKKATKKARKEAKKMTAKAKDAVADMADDFEFPAMPSVSVDVKTKKVKATTPKAKKVVKKVTKKVTAKKPTTKKVVAKKTSTAKATVRKTVKKVAPKKVVAKKSTRKATAKSDVKANDLTIINGIGPKVKVLLNKAGIVTFKELSTTKITVLRDILTEAGSRYKLINPGTWKAEAKLAAAGKMDLLKEFQAQQRMAK